ncbi:PLC-like phosphodiesterase [Dactylonectria macrodidyma]|uniref:PLC-like phosphodiesterase n=1 Tax=Dactylonectria macrodidyma TaxID=307937 RepID=A0A9P9J3J3_9HYPO|nr:PLC-like phosphodiesterase [Dactylonectria macrodidyma]
MSQTKVKNISLRRLVPLLGVLVGIVDGLPTRIRLSPNPDATAISFIESQAEVIRDHSGAAQLGHRVELLIDTNEETKAIEQRVPRTFGRSDPIPTGFVLDTAASHTRLPEPDRVDRTYMLAPDIPAIDDPSTFLGPESEATLKQKQQPHYERQPEEEDKKLSKRWVGPEGRPVTDDSTIITLINATPYRWRKGYSHSYQLEKWEERFPRYIEPGRSERVFSDRVGGLSPWDSAGEVVYHIEGTSKPMSFMIERRSGKTKQFRVQWLEEFVTHGSQQYTQMGLGFHPFPGGSVFMLGGKEGDFITTAPPEGWMQNLLPDIGHLTLREIVLPRTHHSGMYKGTERIGIAPAASTLTQTKDVSWQLEGLGIRVLDLRPILYEGKFRAGHGASVLGEWNGWFGESLEDIARAVGEFHRHYPGEMVIIDIPAFDTGKVGNRGIKPLNDDEIQAIYRILVNYARPFKLPDNTDITKWPLSRFIGDKKGGTIIRVSPSWAEKKNFPGGASGLVSDRNFPMNHRWSEKEDGDELFADQIKYLRHHRPSRQSRIFHSDWVITLSDAQAVFPTQKLTKRALYTYAGLYQDLWNATSDSLYPNWIAMDNVHSAELTTFVMILNKCFVARQCGSMGGKVKQMEGKVNKGKGIKGKNTKVKNAKVNG